MAGRGRTGFQKRQKEQARLERRQQKAARKLARKAAKQSRQDSSGAPDEYEASADLERHPAED